MDNLIACHDCDLLYETKPIPSETVAMCSRCGAALYRHKNNSIDRTLSMAFTGIILFAIAISFPFLALKSNGQVRVTTIFTGIVELYHQEMGFLASLVFLTAIAIPLAQLLALLYIFIPLRSGRKPWRLGTVWRALAHLKDWSMMEVFMMGILVSLVKLAKLATIVPGIAIYAFAGLIFVLAAAWVFLDPEPVIEALARA